jgi:hypothetical protein
VTVALGGAAGRLATGDAAERTGQPAALPMPDADVLDLAEAGVVPQGASTFSLSLEAPDFDQLDGARPPVELGFEPVDVVAPICEKGLNLVVDATVPPDEDPGSFRHLADRLAAGLNTDTRIWIAADRHSSGPEWVDTVIWPAQGDFGQVLAMRVGVCLAAARREAGQNVFLVGELPAAGTRSRDDSETAAGLSMGELVDQIGSTTASTRETAITTLLRLPAGQLPGLDAIIETLDIGGADTQIFLDEDDRFQPRRSSSRADLDDVATERQKTWLETLHRAEQAREKRQIWGDVELSPAERETIEKAERLVASIPPLGPG